MRAIRALIAIVVITQLPASLPGQAGDAFSAYRVRNVPPWALKALGAQFQTQYEWYDRVNPFYQRGDFDGDGKADVALLIRHKVSRKVGIAFVQDRKSTRLNSSHSQISYAVFCLKQKRYKMGPSKSWNRGQPLANCCAASSTLPTCGRAGSASPTL